MAKNKTPLPMIDEQTPVMMEQERRLAINLVGERVRQIVGEVFGGPVVNESRLYEDLLFDVFDRDDVLEGINTAFKLAFDQDDPRLDAASTVQDLTDLVCSEKGLVET